MQQKQQQQKLATNAKNKLKPLNYMTDDVVFSLVGVFEFQKWILLCYAWKEKKNIALKIF